jgi:hypothetical protein
MTRHALDFLSSLRKEMNNGTTIQKDYLYPPEDDLRIPRRGPVDSIDYIKPRIENSSCCETGSASGCLLAYALRYSSTAIGVEFRKSAVEHSVKRTHYQMRTYIMAGSATTRSRRP